MIADSHLVSYVKKSPNMYEGRQGHVPDLWVVHAAQTGEGLNTAEGIVNYFHAPAVRASTQYAVDVNSIAQAVKEVDTCFGARGANNRGIHIEHAGMSEQTREQWLDAYGLAMLSLSAELAAERMDYWDIPIVVLDDAAYRNGARGIVTHAVIDRVNGPGYGHWDPGPAFPMDVYVTMIRQFAGQPPEQGDVDLLHISFGVKTDTRMASWHDGVSVIHRPNDIPEDGAPARTFFVRKRNGTVVAVNDDGKPFGRAFDAPFVERLGDVVTVGVHQPDYQRDVVDSVPV